MISEPKKKPVLVRCAVEALLTSTIAGGLCNNYQPNNGFYNHNDHSSFNKHLHTPTMS
jgi:hypothetical protein